jgi:apolipoprotein N-acyltransferase
MSPRRPALKRWSAQLAAGFGCGFLVAMSVPPFGWWPLAWLGFAGLALLIVGQRLPGRARIGLGAGLGQFVPGLWWVQEFSVPGCVVLMLVSALFVAVACSLVPSSRRRGIVLGLPALIVVMEWVRDRFPLGGFPMGGAALGQTLSLLAPSLRLGGSLLLLGTTVLAGAALTEAVHLVRYRLGPVGRGWKPYFCFGGLAVATAAVPLAGWLSPSGTGSHIGSLRVALVQGGGQRGTRAVDTDPQIVFDRHLSASAALKPPLDLVVWPEGVLQSDTPFQESPDAAEVAALAQRLKASVLVGVEQDVGTRHYLNQVVVWDQQGAIVSTYVKNHLVPFGEYIPWRSVLSRFFNLADVPLDAIPGHSAGFLRTPAAPLGVMISYEVFFDERARGGRAGGQVLVVPTNTASYRSSQVPTQELAAARERAWETGRWVLQVTPTGYSAVVEPDGRVLERSILGRQQVLYATVPRETGRTVYVALGDTPVVASAAAVAIIAAVASRRRRTSPGEGEAVLEEDPETEPALGQ